MIKVEAKENNPFAICKADSRRLTAVLEAYRALGDELGRNPSREELISRTYNDIDFLYQLPDLVPLSSTLARLGINEFSSELISCNGNSAPLTLTEYEIVNKLLVNFDKFIGLDQFGETPPGSVRTHILRLRRKLKIFEPQPFRIVTMEAGYSARD